MKEELKNKLWKNAKYNWPENNEEDCNLANAYMMGATDLLKEVWHEVEKEIPTYHDDNFHSNQIAVIGDTSGGVGMAVCSMISEDEIYSPVSRKEYKWGVCPFTHWAYVEDLLPTPGYKEFSSKIKTEE